MVVDSHASGRHAGCGERSRPLPTRRRDAFWHVFAAVLTGLFAVQTCAAYYVDGDPIGADSSTTDNTGGFAAVEQDGMNLGQPAIRASLTGQELLTELRVIVFGIPAVDGSLYFNEFDYHLDLWTSQDYFANKDPQFRLALGAPQGVRLVPGGPTSVVPETPFGNAGIAGDDATTYDFRFDLTQLPQFESPLTEGNWVFAFQSWHDPAKSGSLRVTGAVAGEGPLPHFSRENVIPRGILGGQDPNNIMLYWGMSLAARPMVSPCMLAADFNADDTVDAADYTLWRDGLGAEHTEPEYELWKGNFGATLPDSLPGDFNLDEVVDAADYTLWRDGLGANYSASDYELWRDSFGMMLPTPVAGDFNGSGAVDAADYTIWRDNFGAASESCLCGAGDGSDGVDQADYALWRQNYGTGSAATDGRTTPVPEPASRLLLVGAGLIHCRRRGRLGAAAFAHRLTGPVPCRAIRRRNCQAFCVIPATPSVDARRQLRWEFPSFSWGAHGPSTTADC